MPTLQLNSAQSSLESLDVDAIVVGINSSDKTIELGPGAAAIDAALAGKLADTLRQLGATGATGQVTKLATLGATTAPVIAAVGLGERNEDGPSHSAVRSATGAAIRALTGTHRVAVALAADDAALLRPIVEGAALAAYDFTAFKSEKGLSSNYRAPVAELVIVAPALVAGSTADIDSAAEVRRGGVVARAVHQVRDWVNTPPNFLRPHDLATAAADLATKAGVSVEVLDEVELAAQGYGGLIAVGSGSDAKPRLVRLAYRPFAPGDYPHVALIGKGITFDTGGISIKPSAGMHEMKSDMAGAAAVIATMAIVAELKLPIQVTAYVPIAENMPSGSAYRPGDVITLFGGQRVEILNTDAEGRLILGDAIGRACQDEPDYLIETSTLTGGQVIALGKQICGVMGTDELCQKIVAAGEVTGERMWQMPLAEDVRSGMDSVVGDFSQVNASMDRAGHMLQGGLFLRECVSGDIPWAHIDIAGPAYNSGGPHGFITKGGTGVPVRTLVEVLEGLATA